jgi:vacuolar-type H+-ATPase subunit H
MKQVDSLVRVLTEVERDRLRMDYQSRYKNQSAMESDPEFKIRMREIERDIDRKRSDLETVLKAIADSDSILGTLATREKNVADREKKTIDLERTVRTKEAEIDKRASEAVARANAQASENVARATRQAEELTASAAKRADEAIARAAHQSTETLQNAVHKANEQVAEARRKGEEILSAARRKGEEIVGAAEKDAVVRRQEAETLQKQTELDCAARIESIAQTSREIDTLQAKLAGELARIDEVLDRAKADLRGKVKLVLGEAEANLYRAKRDVDEMLK